MITLLNEHKKKMFILRRLLNLACTITLIAGRMKFLVHAKCISMYFLPNVGCFSVQYL